MRKTLDYCVLINPTDKMSVLSLEKQHYSITKVEQTKKGFYVYGLIMEQEYATCKKEFEKVKEIIRNKTNVGRVMIKYKNKGECY